MRVAFIIKGTIRAVLICRYCDGLGVVPARTICERVWSSGSYLQRPVMKEILEV
jgi:hypothetical protein